MMGTLKNQQTKTHNSQILSHMVEKGSITPLAASHCYGCIRLSARIYDLRRMGIEIEMTRQKFINRNDHHGTYAVYSIIGEIPESAKHLLK
jgi:hypothetical protein